MMMDCRTKLPSTAPAPFRHCARIVYGLAWIAAVLPFSVGSTQELVSQTVLFDTAEVRQLTQRNAAQLSPSILALGPGNKTGSLTLTNPTDHELVVALKLEFYQAATDSAGAFISIADTLSSARVPSLASWIKDFPSQITLAPNASKTIAIQLVVPSSVPPTSAEEFWAQVVATSPTIQQSLSVVSRQVIADDSGALKLVQQPAKGNISIPLVSTTKILYRRVKLAAGSRISPFRLGTPTSRLLIDGQVEVCAPLRVVTTRGVYARVLLSLRNDEGRDTVFVMQHIDVPAGSESRLRPCFQGILPIELTQATSLTLTIDDNRTDVPDAVRGAFPDIRARVMVKPVPVPAVSGTKIVSPSAGNSNSVSVNEVFATRGSLQAQLRREAQLAAKEGKIALLEIGAAWCGPCRAFLRSLGDSLMIDALRDARVVRVDFDQWGQAFVNSQYRTPPALPIIFLINPDGSQGTMFDINRWQELANTYGTLDARSMAPALKTFIAQLRATGSPP